LSPGIAKKFTCGLPVPVALKAFLSNDIAASSVMIDYRQHSMSCQSCQRRARLFVRRGSLL
jgi:hypothetical protein